MEPVDSKIPLGTIKMDSLFSDAPAPESMFTDAPAPEQRGKLESAARGALRNIPFAQQAASAAAPINPFSEKKTYGEELQHLTEAAEQSKKQNPLSYGAGAVAGTVAPLLIPGVGEAMAASYPAAIGSNAALGAAQSLSDTNLGKMTPKDYGNAAIGAGIGGALGAAGQAIFPAKAALAAKAAAPEAAEAVAPAVAEQAAAPVGSAARTALENAPLNSRNIPNKQVAPDFVPSAERVYASNLAQGFGGTPRQLMRIFGKKDPVKSLNELGGWMETAGPGGKSLHGYLDRPGELLENVTAVNKSSGKVIGDLIEEMGPVASIDREGLKNELLDLSLKTADPATDARIAKLISTVDNLGGKGMSDFEILQQVKKMAGKQISKDPEMSEVYGHLADKASKLVDQYGASIKNPELKQLYAKAKLDYHNSSRILPILRYAEAKDIVGGPAGHHTLRGLLGNIFKIATETVGIPEVGQLGKNIAMKSAPTARNIVNAGSNVRAAATQAASPILSPVAQAAGRSTMSQKAQLELANALQSMYGQREK